MITALKIMLDVLFLLPRLLYILVMDIKHYIIEKRWKLFEGWGLHIYVGRFGSGKTCSMIARAYGLAKKYPQLTIVTNLLLKNFPDHTVILPLNTPQDIINSPENTLVLIDEIGTIFNSRDFSSSKSSVPKILFQHLCQCRKRRMMILATTQRWNFLDKQLRDITATVRVCRTYLSHPFSRLGTVHIYDSFEYDRAYNSPLVPLSAIGGYAYLQTDAVRDRYDTAELVEQMLKMDYVSDEEILRNRGEDSASYTELSRKGKSAAKRGNAAIR